MKPRLFLANSYFFLIEGYKSNQKTDTSIIYIILGILAAAKLASRAFDFEDKW